MKKSISVLICVLLVLCGVPFAVSAEAEDTIDIQIVWDEMCFVYSPEWDYVNREYVDSPVNGWKAIDDANKITVTNNSADKTVTVAFSCDEMAEGVTSFVFYNMDMTPISGGTLEIAPLENNTVKVLPVGVLSPETAAKTRIGSIIITILVVGN